MTLWGALAGGLVGTVLLSTTVRLAQEIGVTRMDIPLLLGTAFTENRSRANLIGYGVHFVNGLVFSLVYAGVFEATGRAGWLFGAGLGLVHGLFAGGVLVNVLLPALHPRMGTSWTDASATPLLEPPGFLLLNYGRHTVLVTLLGHVAYGTIVGAFAAGL
ncbi:MAG: hypothetical protein H0V84_08220 [Actinobacteria bacterium]|nr:hypothetical protein [Actinomycetota bacterium]